MVQRKGKMMSEEQEHQRPSEEEQAVRHRSFLMRISDWDLPGSIVALDAETGKPKDPQPGGRRIDPDTGHVILTEEDKEEWRAWSEKYRQDTASAEDMEAWNRWQKQNE
jgi:hypothetical protein